MSWAGSIGVVLVTLDFGVKEPQLAFYFRPFLAAPYLNHRDTTIRSQWQAFDNMYLVHIQMKICMQHPLCL